MLFQGRKCANVLRGITVDGQVLWNVLEWNVGGGGVIRFPDLFKIESLNMLWSLQVDHFVDVDLIELTGSLAEFRGAPIHRLDDECFVGCYFRLRSAFNGIKELHFIWKNR